MWRASPGPLPWRAGTQKLRLSVHPNNQTEHKQTAEAVEIIMKNVYKKLGIDYKTYVTTISQNGVNVLK